MNGALRTAMLVPSVGLLPLLAIVLSPFRRLEPVRATADPAGAPGSSR